MNRYIRPQWTRGTASRQAHCDLPDNTYEREMSKEGFFGPAALIHHRHPPTGWSEFEGPLRPRAFDLNRLTNEAGCPWSATELLGNAHMQLRHWQLARSMDHLVRNGDGDELCFIHTGRGELFCDFGHLSIEAGDYLLIPRGCLWRITVEQPIVALLIECTNASYTLPDRGLLGPHAIFDPAMLDVPDIDEPFRDQQSDSDEWTVRVKRYGQVSTLTYPFNPLDAIGWHGDLSVLRLNVSAIRPVTSHRYHLPPSAHSTFLGHRFVVCTFVPRPFETDPGALKVPFFHNNDDYDEVLFYHAGEFFSRDNIHPGMLTFHPGGFTHGPHSGAMNNMLAQPKPETEEVAVMIDTRDALAVAGPAGQVEWREYVDSWKG